MKSKTGHFLDRNEKHVNYLYDFFFVGQFNIQCQ